MKRLVALMSMTVIVGVVVLAGMPTSDHVTAQDGSNPTANPYEVGIGDLPSSAGGNPARGMPELREQPRPGLTNPDRQPNPELPIDQSLAGQCRDSGDGYFRRGGSACPGYLGRFDRPVGH